MTASQAELQISAPLDRAAIARRVASLRAELRESARRPDDLQRALDAACESLGGLVRDCGDDIELASRLSEPRAVAGSYVRATIDLSESGVETRQCVDVLRRGHARVIEELAAVQSILLEPSDD